MKNVTLRRSRSVSLKRMSLHLWVLCGDSSANQNDMAAEQILLFLEHGLGITKTRVLHL